MAAYAKYHRHGLEILAFPCNQCKFGHVFPYSCSLDVQDCPGIYIRGLQRCRDVCPDVLQTMRLPPLISFNVMPHCAHVVVSLDAPPAAKPSAALLVILQLASRSPRTSRTLKNSACLSTTSTSPCLQRYRCKGYTFFHCVSLFCLFQRWHTLSCRCPCCQCSGGCQRPRHASNLWFLEERAA